MKPAPHSCLVCASYLDIEDQCLSGCQMPDQVTSNVCPEFEQKGKR
jgi:hypothetical protein